MKKTFIVAAATLALSCLSSTPSIGATRERISVRISRADLDLSNPAHRRIFDSRVRRAAAWACAPQSATLSARIDADHCRSEMIEDGTAALARLAEGGTMTVGRTATRDPDGQTGADIAVAAR